MNHISGDIGVIGIAVMGQNLILNMEEHGYTVVAFNRTRSKLEDFLQNSARGKNIIGAGSLNDLVRNLQRPRKIILMVRAGAVIDQVIEDLLALLEKGDILIDGGNSNYKDTARRFAALKDQGIHYIGAGISGGEEGARKGPSIMPGGDKDAWPLVQEILQNISAKTDDGQPCCEWVGTGGAGHFVKMVHNGIEYADMQLICEAYHFMRDGLGLSSAEMAEIFARWNTTELNSYLIEITSDILRYKEKETNTFLLEHILDAAGQKGTGKWTSINALDLGVPLPLITEAVFARSLSARKKERLELASVFKKQICAMPVSGKEQGLWINDLKGALLASRIISYAQGFMLMQEASAEYAWDLDLGEIAMLWREGCIIRSGFLTDIHKAFAMIPHLSFLGSAPYFQEMLMKNMASWRRIVSQGIQIGLPMPTMSSAVSFLDGYTTAKLPANLLQAQRDYFGAHTYERTDKPRGEFFHTHWTGYSESVDIERKRSEKS